MAVTVVAAVAAAVDRSQGREEAVNVGERGRQGFVRQERARGLMMMLLVLYTLVVLLVLDDDLRIVIALEDDAR